MCSLLFGGVSIDVIQTPDEVAREEGALRASSDRVRLRRSSMIKPSSHSLLVVARRCGRVEWSRHPGALSTAPRCDDGYPMRCLKRGLAGEVHVCGVVAALPCSFRCSRPSRCDRFTKTLASVGYRDAPPFATARSRNRQIACRSRGPSRQSSGTQTRRPEPKERWAPTSASRPWRRLWHGIASPIRMAKPDPAKAGPLYGRHPYRAAVAQLDTRRSPL